ncbi:alpha/beta hydrolase [uncultured Kordia sp.]|uniref:alpha/beta hydrolase n=1 Tax=uncultured Kordia sp. TaxID=507699 RepID=UPI002611DD10|nr:alpha/beta hydrolase [uncultured Kordia sp.]
MKKSFFLGVLSLFILVNYSCSSDDSDLNITPTPNNPSTVAAVTTLDISYGSDADQKYDLYLPQNRTLDTKVIILIHGGGWTAGDKADMSNFVELIQTDLSEYAIVNMNYRLANDTTSPFPMQLDDITTLIDELKARNEEYIISEDYAFLGTSAGGHLSLLWSYAYDTQGDVNMVASIVGPTNLTDEAYLNNADPTIQAYFDLFGEELVIPFLETYSPFHRVTNAAPPTSLFYGGQDPLIPNSQGSGLSDRLTELGITHEFTFYPEEGHGWGGQNAIDTWNKFTAFVNEYH